MGGGRRRVARIATISVTIETATQAGHGGQVSTAAHTLR
jgi:hypothetical protein